jgi:hypothetical protein
VLLRLPYLALSSVFTLVRLLPMKDTGKDIEILTLRHQLAILQRQTSKTASQPGRPRPACRPAAPDFPRRVETVTVDRHPGHHHALPPRSHPPPRCDLPT